MSARIVFFAVIAASILAACGGGGGGGGGGSLPGTSATPTPSPGPTSESASVTLSTTTTTAVQFPAIASGASGTITLPAANASTTAKLTFQSSLPTGVATPSLRARASIGGSNLQTLAVITLSVNATIAVSSTPAFSFTLSSAPTGDAYVAYYDEHNPGLGWNVLLGPGTISGNTVAFTAQQLAPPLTLVASDTYVFALVVSSTAATTPATSLSYSGTKTVNYLYGFAFGYPAPGPTATAPPTALSYTVSATVSDGSSPYPGTGPQGLVDEHVAESDAANVSTTTYATDSWLGLTSGSTWDQFLYGTTQQETSSDNQPTTTTLYTNAQQTDQFPASDVTWTNNPAASIAYAYADGDNGTRTVNSDGSYVDTENLLASGAGGTAVLTEKSDGSGSIASSYLDYGYLSSIGFSAPANSAITITFNYTLAAQNLGAPPTATATDGVWYKFPLYTEADSITANAALPQSCGSPFGFVTASHVNHSVVSYDTVVGFEDLTTIDSYEYNGVPLCIVTQDIQLYAYDEQQNTPYLLLYGALGVEVVTTQETLILQTSPAAVLSATTVRPVAAALVAHTLDVFARDRATRVRALVKTMGGKR